MNKTKKRAIQKHRAKARKFDARRKEAGASEMVGSAAMSPRPTGAGQRPRPAQRSPEPALAGAGTGGEQPAE